MIVDSRSRGAQLVERLGLTIIGQEGHNLKLACINCDSSDAFRIHRDKGIGYCHSCKSKYSRLELATKVLNGNQSAAWRLLEEIGLEQPRHGRNGQASNGRAKQDVMAIVAREKGVTVEALKVYGAKVEGGGVVLPMYDGKGQQCSTFAMKPGGGKGLYAEGRRTGLFFPHDENGNVRLPQADQNWHVVEGVKDAAALLALGLLACGLPTSSMARKFARLFGGVDLVLIPDRDQAGIDGAEKTARLLFGKAKSIRIATLPAEFSATKGDDVRDVLKMPDGRELVLQAIADAQPWKPATANRTARTRGERTITVRDPPTLDLHEASGRTDIANARRLVALHRGKMLWCDQWNKWLIWDGRRWAIDFQRQAEALAKDVADAIWKETGELLAKLGSADQQEIIRFARATAGAKGIANMLSLARSEPNISIVPGRLDTHPWLWNCTNGTVDLRTGSVRKHDRADLLTKLCPHEFVQGPEAESPLWDKFLADIFADNADMIRFVQRLFGCALVGEVTEHVLPILWGKGSNGKSVLVEVMLDVFGDDYGCKAARDLLLAKKNESHPTERADLHGKRLVVCSETDEGRRLAEGLVKELTGGDTIKARRMKEDFWSFKPSHTAILTTNHRPEVSGTDHGIWRRLRLVPFTQCFWDADKRETGPPEFKADKQLKAKLKNESAGILRWLVEGCLSWQRDGLGEPAEVTNATADYRNEEDTLGKFIAACCIVESEARAAATDLFRAYREYTGDELMNQTKMGRLLGERGFRNDRFSAGKNKGRMRWCGIGLLTDHAEPSEE